jgi:primosomal protein N'
MAGANVSFGMGCPRCNTVTSVMIGGGDRCPDCGTPLVPVQNAPPMHAGFVCKQCGASIGMAIGLTHCPDCNTPVE